MKKKIRVIAEPFDKIKGLMREKRYTQPVLAKELNISLSALNHKLNGLAAWQWDEMERLLKVLEIPSEQIGDYFFAAVLRKRNRTA